MEVLFIKDVLPTAMAGDVVNVKSGFARNFLFPRDLVQVPTEKNLKRAAEMQANTAKRRAAIKEDWKKVAEQLAEEVFTIEARATEKNRLFGSITSKMVKDAVETQMDFELPKNAVKTPAIRFAGKHSLNLLLHPEIEAKITVLVVTDQKEEQIENKESKPESKKAAADVEDQPTEEKEA